MIQVCRPISHSPFQSEKSSELENEDIQGGEPEVNKVEVEQGEEDEGDRKLLFEDVLNLLIQFGHMANVIDRHVTLHELKLAQT
eukprot:CAMPEP_0175000084 /NCGR_PEP_ID=MMETSP0005-20121125/2398_1 /TAXON_ID=420556 /ORGANISM="Ochromonas sp., Strain CCMP1393" /LENGTH=83 /DNA_ID=CAMNT_0016254853 /DNA_START=113 /DNA_END=361 /DNA_ORIENTATION=-